VRARLARASQRVIQTLRLLGVSEGGFESENYRRQHLFIDTEVLLELFQETVAEFASERELAVKVGRRCQLEVVEHATCEGTIERVAVGGSHELPGVESDRPQ